MKPILNRNWILEHDKATARILTLPEKVMQFGTGVLLRALPDYYIHKANLQHLFNGRVVMVKSTARGETDVHVRQDCLYTTCLVGIKQGQPVKERLLNSSVSRILSASDQWAEVLTLANSEALEVVISNTTEVGLQYVPENIGETAPASFPGKLLAVLHSRYQYFSGDRDKGLVIIPTELLPDNGLLLKNILNQLAEHNEMSGGFIEWLNDCNQFCSSLVDRIVPGKPSGDIKIELDQELPYQDDALILAEPYGLWAIEGNEKVKEVLSFNNADSGCIVEPDITVYRELKLRLLNATHTLSCAYALKAGFETVIEAMRDPGLRTYVTNLMQEEIAQCIPYDIEPERIHAFADDVIDRFSNPYLQHRWLSISVQYSSKVKMRVLPLWNKYLQKYGKPAPLMLKGLNAFLEFMRPVRKEGDRYYGSLNGKEYLIDDSNAATFYEASLNRSLEEYKELMLSYTSLWGQRIQV